MNGFYVLNSLLWSIAGGAAGFKVGRMQRDLTELKRRAHMDEPVERPNGSRWALHKPNVQQIIGIAVVIMAVLSVGTVVAYSQRLNNISECLAVYISAYNDALRARDDVAQASRQGAKDFASADKELWLGFLKNAPAAGQPATSEQRAASIAVLNQFLTKTDGYITSLDRVSQARAAFPLPDNHCPSPKVQATH